jgi:hypothetical protein
MSEFEKRLQKATRRGEQTSNARAQAEARKALDEQELRRLHTQYRIDLSEHIESCLREFGDHVPGFQFETVVSDRGWGAAVARDDVGIEATQRRRTNFYSRLEMVIRPISEFYVLDLGGKGTIRNKEVFNRTHYERLADVDLTSFISMIDRWVLEYAELYAAKS